MAATKPCASWRWKAERKRGRERESSNWRGSEILGERVLAMVVPSPHTAGFASTAPQEVDRKCFPNLKFVLGLRNFQNIFRHCAKMWVQILKTNPRGPLFGTTSFENFPFLERGTLVALFFLSVTSSPDPRTQGSLLPSQPTKCSAPLASSSSSSSVTLPRHRCGRCVIASSYQASRDAASFEDCEGEGKRATQWFSSMWRLEARSRGG